jgi:hypothetical protein
MQSAMCAVTPVSVSDTGVVWPAFPPDVSGPFVYDHSGDPDRAASTERRIDGDVEVPPAAWSADFIRREAAVVSE